MRNDPIVEEVHRHREQLSADSNHDLVAFFAAIRERQSLVGERLVRQPPNTKPVPSTVPLTIPSTVQS